MFAALYGKRKIADTAKSIKGKNMSNKKEVDQLNSPIAEFYLEFLAYVIAAILVFALGVVASVVFSDFNHLARAGALITLIAISMAYKDFHLDLKNMSFEEASKFLGKDRLFESWSKSFVHKKREELEKIKPGFNEVDALKVIDQIGEVTYEYLNKDEFIKDWLQEMFRLWSKDLRKLEFTIIKIGTILWAFSDLINSVLGW
ncbi:MAG: hypothetical protein ABJK64_18235 [Paraglaciecola sp.]|uniref:hypothetical protein n=1 Tax=Paraglaciecola sp. TaxID=1920173 RepID=UPI003299BF48